MCGLLIGGDYAGPGRSPDRADALVWALTDLIVDAHGAALAAGDQVRLGGQDVGLGVGQLRFPGHEIGHLAADHGVERTPR